MPLDLFLSAFVSLFVVVDPFGTAAVFVTLSQKMDRAAQIKVAFKAFLIAVLVLLAFSFIGNALLHHMGISLAAFRLAGGLLLFVSAFRMIMGYHDPDALSNADKSAYKDRSDIAVFPMAIPLLAGPGTMTATLMFATAAHTVLEHTVVLGAIVMVQAIALVSLIGAGFLGRIFGPTGNGIIARIMGILLAAMAVQFIADGMNDLFHLKELFHSPIPDVMQG